MFERKNEPLASPEVFRARVIQFFLIAVALTVLWLAIGGIGFHYAAGLSWGDALFNASMILSTMGPAYNVNTAPAMVFTALYALASALVFIAAIGIASAPIIHRAFHIFHLET
jgi:hypothetical protein